MVNLVDIRRKQNLNFILPADSMLYDMTIKKAEVAIFLCLYYSDTIDRYFNYIEAALKVSDVYIATSNEKVFNIISSNYPKARVIKKINRGRDISALLVTFAPYIFNYKYVAFLHDKKAHLSSDEKDTDEWVEDMWENLIASDLYINNIVETFKKNESIGMLVSPELFGDVNGLFYNENWGIDYEITKHLASELNIKADIRKDRGPMMLGTAFWCRTEVLDKIYKRKWKYEDFPDEPLANDGTISHGIERLLTYLAQDKGLLVGDVMTTKNAGKIKEKSQILLKQSFAILKNIGIYNARDLKNASSKIDSLIEFFNLHDNVYLYGAGQIGKRCLKLLYIYDCVPTGFVVTSVDNNPTEINGIHVYQFDQIDEADKKVGFIITVAKKIQNEIEYELYKRGISEFLEFSS